MKIVAFLILITAVTYAQVPASRTSNSDAEKIASAMQAGPKFCHTKCNRARLAFFARRRVPRSPSRHQSVDLSSGSP
jgi:hypothetical protein